MRSARPAGPRPNGSSTGSPRPTATSWPAFSASCRADPPAWRRAGAYEQARRSGESLARPEHLERLLHSPVPGLLAFGVRDPAAVLLPVREGQPLEGRPGVRAGRQGHGQCLGRLDLPGRRVELDSHLHLVAGLHARAVAYLPVQAQQELALHPGHAGPPGVAVDGRYHRESLGALTDLRDLGVVEYDRRGG